MSDVKISTRSRAESAMHLYQSRLWEVQGLVPWARGRRVRRRAGLPVYLPDAIFAPRRAVK